MLETTNKSILVTGASGFIGSAVIRQLAEEYDVKGTVRQAVKVSYPWQMLHVDSMGENRRVEWAPVLHGTGVVIHAAGLAHLPRKDRRNTLHFFREVNTHGTLHLAEQAAAAGVDRFIYLSSIKVNGESSQPEKPFRTEDRPNPSDYYAISKMEAEEGLKKIAEQTGMEVVIIRPVLVYGPGVRANFLALMKWVAKGLPLPLGKALNLRSFVFVDNLVSLIRTCIVHPEAAGRTFLVSDGADISTADLVRVMGKTLGKSPLILPVSQFFLESMASALGRRDSVQRLFGYLQVDIEETKRLLNWRPPVSMEQGLQQTAEHFMKGRI
ncbi:NAD-dependent epimerase/dehydratase family protein [Desulfobotulus sp. H1]|uniref:NAD-dependent epimerase/dehydratase family protein n=1 Tax=Desulfobotulus pelophilus TaxID=2823377 RepID=A0ABT3NCY9_9BACT|nr:NAD-dependent epimerase/dehydratase family protein [Desulfobotulus pelophilus]MCW7755321.1 NAD-dependent epimerase/dehydratase family protein [Desulfobotulus pelophilus]